MYGSFSLAWLFHFELSLCFSGMELLSLPPGFGSFDLVQISMVSLTWFKTADWLGWILSCSLAFAVMSFAIMLGFWPYCCCIIELDGNASMNIFLFIRGIGTVAMDHKFQYSQNTFSFSFGQSFLMTICLSDHIMMIQILLIGSAIASTMTSKLVSFGNAMGLCHWQQCST